MEMKQNTAQYAVNTAVPASVGMIHNTCASEAECRIADEEYRRLLQPAHFCEWPVSFEIDGVQYNGFGSAFRLDESSDKNRLLFTHESGLQAAVLLKQYPAYAAYEWTLSFLWPEDKKGNSPGIRNIHAADFTVSGQNPTLIGIYGDARNEGHDMSKEDFSEIKMNYEPYLLPLQNGIHSVKPAGGCACNQEWPYFHLLYGNEARTIVIGWPGQWKAAFETNGNDVHFTAELEYLDTYLLPGEQVRLPMITTLRYQGRDTDRITNLWRHWFMECSMPRENGAILPPVLCGGTNAQYGCMYGATDQNQKEGIHFYQDNGISLDYWWMDAGWYYVDYQNTSSGDIQDYTKVGSWEVDVSRFPSKFADISREAAKYGVKTLLWFEPERFCIPREALSKKENQNQMREEWLLKKYLTVQIPRKGVMADVPVSFVDLGKCPARRWLTDRIISILEQGGIHMYREDHNIRPLDWWLEEDAPGRSGITENHYLCGHLQMWDDLRTHFNGMVLDSCASGGRRNDLESMRRAVPLHITDFFINNLPLRQSIHQSLYQWFPYFKAEATVEIQKPDLYHLRCGFTPWMNLNYDHTCTDMDFSVIRKVVQEWKSVNQYFYADYYQLLPWNIDSDRYLAFSFIDSVAGEGFIQLYRRENAPETQLIRLKGLDAERVYDIIDFDGNCGGRFTGAALMQDGFIAHVPDCPGAAVLRICAVNM